MKSEGLRHEGTTYDVPASSGWRGDSFLLGRSVPLELRPCRRLARGPWCQPFASTLKRHDDVCPQLSTTFNSSLQLSHRSHLAVNSFCSDNTRWTRSVAPSPLYYCIALALFRLAIHLSNSYQTHRPSSSTEPSISAQQHRALTLFLIYISEQSDSQYRQAVFLTRSTDGLRRHGLAASGPFAAPVVRQGFELKQCSKEEAEV